MSVDHGAERAVLRREAVKAEAEASPFTVAARYRENWQRRTLRQFKEACYSQALIAFLCVQ
jgi:hypothetical protein